MLWVVLPNRAVMIALLSYSPHVIVEGPSLPPAKCYCVFFVSVDIDVSPHS